MDVAHKAGIGLTILGALGLLNGLVASLAGAEKIFYILTDRFVNTHWITVIELFAGIAQLFYRKNSFHSACSALCLNSASLAVAFCAIMADLVNLYDLVSSGSGKFPDAITYERRISYCAVDAILMLTCLPLNIYIVKSIVATDCGRNTESRCVRLLTFGTAQIALSVLRLVAYLMELHMARSSAADKQLRTQILFANYTLDEPVWLTINIFVGAFVVLCSRGGRLLRTSALCLCGVSILPCVFYLWLDYRWYSSYYLAPSLEEHASNPLHLLFPSMCLAVIHLGLLITTLLLLFNQLSQGFNYLRVSLDSKLKSLFLSTGVLFCILAILLIFCDVYSLVHKMFYRLFHGSEQKTPFLLIISAIFCVLTSNPSLSALTLPACLTVSLLSINSTVFALLSYIYLSTNHYFGEQLCDLFFSTSSSCAQMVTIEGARLHFVDALVNFIVLFMSSFITVVVLRISHIQSNSVEQQNEGKTKKYEVYIRTIGVILASCALILLLTTVVSFFGEKVYSHPVIIIYSSLYHISLAISLTVFPLYQILISENLSRHPLSYTALLLISCVRFAEILSQLDYRGTGDVYTIPWKIHHCVEIISLFGHFFTIMFVIRLISINTPEDQSILGQEPMTFNNPLAESELGLDRNGTGYIQLNTEADLELR